MSELVLEHQATTLQVELPPLPKLNRSDLGGSITYALAKRYARDWGSNQHILLLPWAQGSPVETAFSAAVLLVTGLFCSALLRAPANAIFAAVFASAFFTAGTILIADAVAGRLLLKRTETLRKQLQAAFAELGAETVPATSLIALLVLRKADLFVALHGEYAYFTGVVESGATGDLLRLTSRQGSR